MKLHEIEKVYTDIVNGYLEDGYSVNFNTMGGSQGEICKIDLRKGTEIIRVLTEHKMIDWDWAIVITVGRAKNALSNSLREIIWNDDIETIESLEFYELGIKKNGERYFGTKSKAEKCRKNRISRMNNRYICKDMDSEEVKKAVWKVLKKKKGMVNIPYSSIVKMRLVEEKGLKEVTAYVKKNGMVRTELLYVAHDEKK